MLFTSLPASPIPIMLMRIVGKYGLHLACFTIRADASCGTMVPSPLAVPSMHSCCFFRGKELFILSALCEMQTLFVWEGFQSASGMLVRFLP